MLQEYLGAFAPSRPPCSTRLLHKCGLPLPIEQALGTIEPLPFIIGTVPHTNRCDESLTEVVEYNGTPQTRPSVFVHVRRFVRNECDIEYAQRSNLNCPANQ